MIEVLKTGWHNTIQDLGRFGYQELGVPSSGAMDLNAFTWANKLLNNPSNASCIEMTIKGPTLKFHQPTYITITGATMPAMLNSNTVKMYRPIKIQKGDVLQFSNVTSGCRAYLGILGGFETEIILSSKSQYKGLTLHDQIDKKSLIQIKEVPFIPKGAVLKTPLIDYQSIFLKSYKGPEYKLLNTQSKNRIKTLTFTVSRNNNRMGVHLEEKINQKLPEIWSCPSLPGTVQLTPDGTLIILMRDAQVTGGYPRILQLSDDAINLLAQKTTKDQIKFEIKALH